MAPTISVANERKTKCRKSQRRIHHTNASLVSVISYGGRTTLRHSCWNQRSARSPLVKKLLEGDNRRKQVDRDFNEDAQSEADAMETQRRHSTNSMRDRDTSSSDCSSTEHSLDLSRTQFYRCDSPNMSDSNDDGYNDDKSDMFYSSMREMWPVMNKKYNDGQRNGLLDIAIKTIKLIRRNQLLQAKLTQLQAETRAFIVSVMANPENRKAAQSISNPTSPVPALAYPLVDEPLES